MGAKSSLANLPRLSHLRPTILGIVTGLPVLAVLATHLSHHASGWDLPSWWLALGSSLFNVFLASATLISLLFAFLCASLLRRLRNLLILITAPTRHPNGLTLAGGGEDSSGPIVSRLENVKARGDVRIIRRRVAFLRRAAAIFSSMVVMETASVFYINIPDDVVTHYFFSISSALLGVVIFVCYVVRSEAPLGLCRLFRGGRRKRVRGKRDGRRLRCAGVSGGPEDNEDEDEEDDEDDDDEEDEESDSSDSLDSPLTLSLKPDLGNEDSSFHGSLRKKTFKKQGSDPGTGETYIDANPLTDEELAVALAKKSLSLQASGISLSHDQCSTNPAFDSADLVDAVLPYSEWKQREAGGGAGRKPQRSNSCCGVAGRICAEEDDTEDDQNRPKGICKQASEDVVVVKAQVEVNPPKSSLRSPKDSGRDAPEKTVAFSASAKTPTTVRKSILKNPLPPKSVTILNPEPDVVEKEPPFPLVLDGLPPPMGDPGLLSLNAVVLSPEGYEGVTEPLQCPDVLDVPENRIPMGVGVCGSVDPERIVLTNDEVRRNSYPSVRVVPLATAARPTPDNIPLAPGKYSLYRSAGGTLGSKEMKIIEEEEEEDGDDAMGASSGPCPKSKDAAVPAPECAAEQKVLDERVLQELRRRPEGREEGKDSIDEAFASAKAEASPSAAVNGDGDGGAEDLDGMLDRITLDLDYLLNRTPKHGTKAVGKEDVDLELPEEMIALSTFETPEPPPPDPEIN
ncbi:F-actin-monooxygenase MICAL3-like [Hetaerina americana]|uniref:F-actin-monooxygenase MICAL3-like n=1 Tax=Hetaerina americana TaxID=62018 RepID=UPI003A7F43F0